MKYIRHTLLLLVTVLILSGCSSKNPDKTQPGVPVEKDNNPLIGGWSYELVPRYFDESGYTQTYRGVYIFESDGTVKAGDYPVFTDPDIEKMNNHLCKVYNRKYEVNNNTLTINPSSYQYNKYKLKKTETGYYCTPFSTVVDGVEYNYEEIEKNPEKYDMNDILLDPPPDFELREYDGDFESCFDEYKACEDAYALSICEHYAYNSYTALSFFVSAIYNKTGNPIDKSVYIGNYSYDKDKEKFVEISDEYGVEIDLTDISYPNKNEISSDYIYYVGVQNNDFFVQAKEKNRDDIINQYPYDIPGSFEGLKESKNVVWGEYYHKY